MKWINNLRAKPIETRIRIIWISAAVAAILLIGAWILIGNYHYSSVSGGQSINQIVNEYKSNMNK